MVHRYPILSLVRGLVGNVQAAEMLAKKIHRFQWSNIPVAVVGSEGNYSLQNYGKENFPDCKT